MYATPIDLALDLDAGIGQVLDPALIADVAMDRRGPAALRSLDDQRPILMPALARDRRVASQHRCDQLVVGASPLRPVVGVEAAFPEIPGARVFRDEIGPLAEVGHVLGEVTA